MNVKSLTAGAVRVLIAGSLACAGFTNAYAVDACGGVQYPTCALCTTPWFAATLDHGYCVSCPGLCYTRLRTNDQSVGGSGERKQFKRVIHQNPIDVDSSLLMRIGQANPGAAIVLDMFSARHEMTYASIMQGKVASQGIPTISTLQLRMEASPDDEAIRRSFGSLAVSGQYVETQWTSAGADSGNLVVTFETRVMNQDGSVDHVAYPPIVVTLQNASPTRVLAWRVGS